MIIEPIGERVLIKALPQVAQTSGGIYIPDSAKKERKEGIVVAVGKSANGTVLPLQTGDHVIFTGFSTEEFEYNNQKYKMVDFKDIIAKVHNHV